MAGRGGARGGAGGRGRGRAAMSFNVEQLGFAPGEVLPGPVLTPPLLFPILEFRPAPLDTSVVYQQQVRFKAQLVNFFKKSDHYIRPVVAKMDDTTHWTDLSDVAPQEVEQINLNWSRFPPELRPSVKRKKSSVKLGVLTKKNIANLNTLLEELEKKENQDTGEEEDEEKEKKKDDDEKEDDEAEEVEEEDLDEEMDDGTDYNQNYFDNGEGYLDDEDDNLDDDPVY